MMEPTIKSEPCEELYSEQEADYQVSRGTEGNEATSQQSQPQSNLKRLYEEMSDISPTNRNINQHHPNSSYYQSFEFPSGPQHIQNSFNIQESNQSAPSEEKQLKKLKRMEGSVLFHKPFFNLVEELLSSHSDAIAARCYGCGKIVKGNRGISSNFIKHMKRSHPESYKLYDGYKSNKTKSYYLPNLPEMVAKKSAPTVENGASGSDSTTANSNDDTNQFSETNTVLEATGLNDSSDENEDSVNVTNKTVGTKEFEFSSKALEALGNIIDGRLKSFVKQKQYEELNEKVNTLAKMNKTPDCGTNASLMELKTEFYNLKKECSELRSAIQRSQASKRQLQHELQTVDKLFHQRKLIIRNLSVSDPENPLDSVKTLFKETMHLEDIKIVHCCIIPSVKISPGSDKEIVSIELASPRDCKKIFRQTKNLKNSGIFIETEISPFQRKRKNKLMVLRKELLRRKPDVKVLVRDTTLIVNGKNFYWDDVEGLCHDYKYDAIDLNGVQYLELISGLDLKEFIIFLQNYNVQIT